MQNLQLFKTASRHMATDFELDIVVEPTQVRSADSVLAEARRLIEEVESNITEYRASSPVYRLNHAPVGEWVEFGPILKTLLKDSLELERLTGGYFSPFAKSGVKAPVLEVDWEGSRFRRKSLDVHLGFGAIGKGFALDRVASLLAREGFTHFRLSCGGSSFVFSGYGPDEKAWSVAWAWKRDSDGDFAGQAFVLPAGQHVAIGVSGVLEQGNHFKFQGSAAPILVQSSFYAGRSAAEADAFSTALLVGASIEGDGVLTRLESGIREPAMAYVDLEEQIIYNKNFQNRFFRS